MSGIGRIATQAIEAVRARPLLVNLGDSFSSGMGSETLPKLLGNTVDMGVYGTTWCNAWRSTHSAANLLARAGRFELRDASYAGSTTDALLGATGVRAAQLDAVSAQARAVTLTIGGNDVRMIDLVDAAAHGDHARTAAAARTVDTLTDALRPKLDAVLAGITQRAPDAEIRIAGYPHLLSDPAVVRAQDRLNGVIRDAAASAGPRVRYVDPHAPGSPFVAAGDARSSSAKRWVNGIADEGTQAFEYHPNVLGYRHYARLFADSLKPASPR